MHLIRLLLDLIQGQHQQRRQIEALHRDTFALNKELHKENQAEAYQIGKEFEHLDARLDRLEQLIIELQKVFIPEIVTNVKLVDETGDQMEIEVGKPRQFRVDTFGASGNPTVPVGAPTLTLTDTSSFTADSTALTMVPTGAEGSSTDITVTVDGVTSPALSYTIKAEGPPPAEPVNSVVLVDVTP